MNNGFGKWVWGKCEWGQGQKDSDLGHVGGMEQLLAVGFVGGVLVLYWCC